MRAGMLMVVIAVIFATAASAAIIYNFMLAQEASYFTPMKDDVIAFIASNHADAEPFMTGMSLTYIGGGAFSGGGWVLRLSGSMINGTATADFSMSRTQNSTGIPHRILWSGTITNGTIVEASYSHAV